MKAKKFAACGVLLPLAMLCACGGGTSALTVNANWYKDPGERAVVAVNETLEYSVKGEPNAESGYALSTSYEGTYTTTLGVSKETVGGKNVVAYYLHAVTTLNGVFELKGEQHTFVKSIDSEVWFRGVEDNLRPIRSKKYVKDTLPVLNEADGIEGAYEEYEYTQTVVYNEEYTRATLTLDYADETHTDFEKEIKLSGNATLFDNEEIVFGLRGLDLSANAVFRTVDFARRKQINVSLTADSVTEGAKRVFTLNGTEGEQELDVAAVNLAYSGSNAGYPWHLEYARPRQDDNPNSNKYRNVMLYAEQTTLYNLCTLTYTLTGATFSET